LLDTPSGGKCARGKPKTEGIYKNNGRTLG
jgi:hypothetical protein